MKPIAAFNSVKDHPSLEEYNRNGDYNNSDCLFLYRKDGSKIGWNESAFGDCKELLIQDLAIDTEKSFGLIMSGRRTNFKSKLEHNLDLIFPQRSKCLVENIGITNIILPRGIWKSNLIMSDFFVIITRLTWQHGKFNNLESLINKLRIFDWGGYNYYNGGIAKLLTNLHHKPKELRQRNFLQKYFEFLYVADGKDIEDYEFEEYYETYYGIVNNSYEACSFLKI